MLAAGTLDEQAEEALSILRTNGYYEEQDTLLASHEWLNLWRSLNPTYAAAHGRFAVWEVICGISFAADRQRREANAAAAGCGRQSLLHQRRHSSNRGRQPDQR